MSVQRVTITTYAPTLSGSVSRVTLVSQAVTGPQGTSGTGGDMMKADNLSGLSNYTTARSNLGLGTAATTAATAYATSAQGTKADSALQVTGTPTVGDVPTVTDDSPLTVEWAEPAGGGLTVTDSYGNTVADVTSLYFPTPQVIVDGGNGQARIYATEAAAQPDLVDLVPIGAYGDEMNTSGSVGAPWTLRNCTATGDGTGYTAVMNDQGDAMTRAFTDPAADFDLMVHITGLTSVDGMLGLCALDANGDGIGFSGYSGTASYLWTIDNYAYSGTAASGVGAGTNDSWFHLRRRGTAWSGRRLLSSGWEGWSATATDGRTITQVGLLRAFSNGGDQSPRFERFVYGTPSIAGGITP